jgi:glycerophosphoryl diester phosphodiesterase
MRRRPLGVALLAMVLGAPALAGSPALVAAHRGGARLWPENSLLAFRGALALGVDLVETDVHMTADGEVVALHDPTLDRTTSGQGAVRDVRAADVAAVRLRGLDGAPTDEPVPTLAALLDLLRPSTVRLLLEIKVGADGRPYAGIEDRVLALLGERALRGRTIVMAFEPDTLRRVRARDASVATSLLIGRRQGESGTSGAAAVAAARAVGATDLGLDHRLIDANLVRAVRTAGLRLAAWTVNEEADIRRLLALGIDIVISDRPDLVLRLRRS